MRQISTNDPVLLQKGKHRAEFNCYILADAELQKLRCGTSSAFANLESKALERPPPLVKACEVCGKAHNTLQHLGCDCTWKDRDECLRHWQLRATGLARRTVAAAGQFDRRCGLRPREERQILRERKLQV